MKKSLLMKTMLLLFALIVGSTSSWAVEQVYYTLDPITGTNNSYAGNCDVTIDEITWNVTGNATFTPWRIGGKSLSGVDRAVYSKTAMGAAITKVNLALGNASSITINSVKLIVSTAENGSGTIIDEVTKTSVSANSTLTFTPTTPLTEWAKNAYYKFVFNVTVTGSSNKFVEFGSADFYYNMATSATLDHITLGGTYQTEFEQGSDFNHDGLTVTAHYSDASTLDVTSSATFTGYNMNTLGKQTVTVSYEENSVTKTATYDITVVPVPTPVVTLDFTSNEWGISASPNKTVDATVFTRNGYSITLEGSAGNGYYFDTNNIMLGKSGATLTLPAFGFNVSKIKVYGTSGASASVKFNVFVGDEAVSTEVTNSTDDHEFAIEAGKQAVGTIYTIKVTNSYNMRTSKIEVYGNGCEAGVVTDAGWATYVTACDMEFAEGDAFVVSAANATTATLTGVTKIRANQPVLLKGEGAKTAKVLDEAPAAVSNELAISNGGEIDGFVLAKPAGKSAGFYKWNGGSLTSGKVYLPAPTAAREYLEFSFDGETTAIERIANGQKPTANSQYFDLQGRKVAQPTKGLYIVNGKKVILH